MFWTFVRIASVKSPHWGDSNKYPNHMFLEVLNTILLHNFGLTVTSLSRIIIITKIFVVSSVSIKIIYSVSVPSYIHLTYKTL